jgi:transcription elongation factor Elf1
MQAKIYRIGLVHQKELKPCPFCGNSKTVLLCECLGEKWVSCTKCGVSTTDFETYNAANNQRPTDYQKPRGRSSRLR